MWLRRELRLWLLCGSSAIAGLAVGTSATLGTVIAGTALVDCCTAAGHCARGARRAGPSHAHIAAQRTVAAHVHLAPHEPLELVDTCILVVVNPPHTIEVADCPHVLREDFRLRPLEVVQDWNDVALALKSFHNLPVNPVLAVGVTHAPVEGVGREDK